MIQYGNRVRSSRGWYRYVAGVVREKMNRRAERLERRERGWRRRGSQHGTKQEGVVIIGIKYLTEP